MKYYLIVILLVCLSFHSGAGKSTLMSALAYRNAGKQNYISVIVAKKLNNICFYFTSKLVR